MQNLSLFSFFLHVKFYNIEFLFLSSFQNEMARKLLQLNNPLGLLLSPPPYWMDSVTNPNHARTIEAGVFHESSNQSMDSSDFGHQLMSYRLRASNFAASFIKIGEWQVIIFEKVSWLVSV